MNKRKNNIENDLEFEKEYADILLDEKSGKRSVGNIIAIVISAIVFIVSVFFLAKIIYGYLHARSDYSNISKKYTSSTKNEEEDVTWIDFDGLKETNGEVIAWIDFINEPEVINYPIVKADDNSYYLNHTFERKKSSSGAIFADYHNNADFSDMNVIIYGHNMKDRSMFGNLRNYRNDNGETYFNVNQYFYVYLPGEDGSNIRRKYQVFSAYVIDCSVDETPYTIFNADCNMEEYINWLNNAKNKSKVKSDMTLDATTIGENSHCITMSTCTNTSETGRLIVYGIQIDQVRISKDKKIIK